MASTPFVPRRMRQLPPALPAKDTDVFAMSQMDPTTGQPTTRAMTRAQFNQEITDTINLARSEFVAKSDADHAAMHDQLDSLADQVAANQLNDAQMQAALVMVQQMINGESGKTPYDLWLEAGHTGSMQDYLGSMVGPQGPSGPKGDKGDKGDQGSIGEAGPIGPQGPSGATGLKGDKGDVGATGSQGPKGDTGPSGPVGSVGPKGDTGSAGATGSSGPAGPKGDQGQSGATGSAGTPGAVILGEVDVLDQAVVALGLGIRSKDVTVPSAWGLKTTDTLFVTPAASLPSGYAIDNAIPLSTTSIRIYYMGPGLALLASNTLRVRVAAIARA